MPRELTYAQAINEATDLCMANDSSVYLMGLGVPDPGGVFGTTLGLQEKYGEERVMDMPTSENGMTGVAIGSAMVGMRPIMTHQRLEFALLAVEQIVNQAAKASYVSGFRMPIVIRMIVGRGWGQGPQHSQSLHSWFAHIPGLKVIMPVTPYDAKGMLISAVNDNSPVIIFEHRWLHSINGEVPQGMYEVPIGKARLVKKGHDITLVALSHMVVEAVHAANWMEDQGVSVEIIDVRSLKPLDQETLLSSVRKTGRLVVADTAWKSAGFSGEIVALIAEKAFESLQASPRRVTPPDVPTPASPALAKWFYPTANDLVREMILILGNKGNNIKQLTENKSIPTDIPDPTFKGPF